MCCRCNIHPNEAGMAITMQRFGHADMCSYQCTSQDEVLKMTQFRVLSMHAYMIDSCRMFLPRRQGRAVLTYWECSGEAIVAKQHVLQVAKARVLTPCCSNGHEAFKLCRSNVDSLMCHKCLTDQSRPRFQNVNLTNQSFRLYLCTYRGTAVTQGARRLYCLHESKLFSVVPANLADKYRR